MTICEYCEAEVENPCLNAFDMIFGCSQVRLETDEEFEARTGHAWGADLASDQG